VESGRERKMNKRILKKAVKTAIKRGQEYCQDFYTVGNLYFPKKFRFLVESEKYSYFSEDAGGMLMDYKPAVLYDGKNRKAYIL
jgi:hypothetical protein